MVWDIFENLREDVYAADPFTNELIFINKSLRGKLGISSLDEVRGKKCYEVICHQKGLLSICSFRDKELYQYELSVEHDVVTETSFVKQETFIEHEGRTLRLGFLRDISDTEYLNQHERLEVLANRVLNQTLKEQDPDRALTVLMGYLGRLFKADRAYIIVRNPDLSNSFTYEWIGDGVVGPQHIENVPEAVGRSYYAAFEKEQAVLIKDIEAIRATDLPLYEIMHSRNVHSIVVVPLYSGDRILGCFGVDNPEALNMDSTFDMIKLMCRFIVFTLERRNLNRRLEILSYTDQLTGFLNRHALTKMIREDLTGEQKLGVVFCDIAGLKAVNDRDGHEAGDRYIIAACDLLRQIFPQAKHYRLGGDEFLTVCFGIEESAFADLVGQLNQIMQLGGPILSVGHVYFEGDYVFQQVVEIAEKRMYDDKTRYYQMEGNDRRVNASS